MWKKMVTRENKNINKCIKNGCHVCEDGYGWATGVWPHFFFNPNDV